MEKYVKPAVVQVRYDVAPVAPLFPVAAGVGFLAGLASGDSHSVGGRNVEYLEVSQKNNGVG